MFLNGAFLGLREPLVTPLSTHIWTLAKNLDQLYSSINHHRTTINLSDIVWCMSGVWWYLVVSGACLVVLMYIG